VATERNHDMPWAATPTERLARFDALIEHWGTGSNLQDMAPGVADDLRMRDWLGKLERLSTTPAGVVRLAENLATHDVRPLLATLRVPTLVLHRVGDRFIDIGHSRLFAERIPGARLVELPGADSLPMVGDTEALL